MSPFGDLPDCRSHYVWTLTVLITLVCDWWVTSFISLLLFYLQSEAEQ
jgi:hypothetical protein